MSEIINKKHESFIKYSEEGDRVLISEQLPTEEYRL